MATTENTTTPPLPVRLEALRAQWRRQQKVEDAAFMAKDVKREAVASGGLAGILTATAILLGIPQAEAHGLLEGEITPDLSDLPA